MKIKINPLSDELRQGAIKLRWEVLVQEEKEINPLIFDSALLWADNQITNLEQKAEELKQIIFELHVELNGDPEHIKRVEKTRRASYLFNQLCDRLHFIDDMSEEEILKGYNAGNDKQKARMKKLATFVMEYLKPEREGNDEIQPDQRGI